MTQMGILEMAEEMQKGGIQDPHYILSFNVSAPPPSLANPMYQNLLEMVQGNPMMPYTSGVTIDLTQA